MDDSNHVRNGGGCSCAALSAAQSESKCLRLHSAVSYLTAVLETLRLQESPSPCAALHNEE